MILYSTYGTDGIYDKCGYIYIYIKYLYLYYIYVYYIYIYIYVSEYILGHGLLTTLPIVMHPKKTISPQSWHV